MRLRIFRSRKALYFITLVSVFLIISLGAMLYFISKTQSEDLKKGDVGQKAVLITKTYQDAETSLFFIDLAAKYSAVDAYLMTAFNGALPDNSPCGSYYGFAVWDFDDEKCLPMGSSKPIKGLFEKEMNLALNNYFRLSPDWIVLSDNYKVNIFENGQLTFVTGVSKIPLYFEIAKTVTQTGYSVYTSIPTGHYSSTELSNNPRVRYLLKNNKYVTPEFLNKVGDVANDVGADPINLMIVMKLESSFSPSIVNSIGCTGLIQFCPNGGMVTVGTSRSELVSMTATEQLDKYVRLYLKKEMQRYNIPKLNTLVLLYLAVLYPSSMKDATNPNAIVWKAGSAAQRANPIFTGGVKRDVYVRDIESALIKSWNSLPQEGEMPS